MSTITREQLHERAREKVKSLEFAVTQTAFADSRAELEEELELARIALASLEAEPVISHVGSKNALDDIVAFIKSNRNPTLKDHNQVSERLFQDNCHGISNHVIEYIKRIGEELEELRSAQDSAPPAPESVTDYPETLPCPVMLEPGLRFGKGVPTRTMLGALQRRAEYYAEIEAMTPEQRAEHDAGMKEFAAMLQGADGNSPVIANGWVACSERMPVENDIVLVVDDGYFVCEAQYRDGDFYSAARGNGEFFETTCRDVELWMPLPAAPQQEVAQALAKGMERYGDAMQELAKKEVK